MMNKNYIYIGGILIGLGAIALLVMNIKKSNKGSDDQESKEITALLKKIDAAKK
jgi:hypothetical protein